MTLSLSHHSHTEKQTLNFAPPVIPALLRNEKILLALTLRIGRSYA